MQMGLLFLLPPFVFTWITIFFHSICSQEEISPIFQQMQPVLIKPSRTKFSFVLKDLDK